MTFFLSTFFFIFSVVSGLSEISTNSTLLSLRCINPSPSNIAPHHNINPIETLLDNLTSVAPKSRFTTLTVTFGNERYSGLMQCRPGLGPKACTLCAKKAHDTISSLCGNSNTVSSWFDGCYVQISLMTGSSDDATNNVSNHSCLGRAKNRDPARFEPAMGTLFLKLRAEVNIATRYRFSYGEIAYGGDGKMNIYGLVECVRSLTTNECNSCVEKAVEKLMFYCGGENGGTVVYGLCLVRFDGEEFYNRGEVSVSSDGGGGAWGNFTAWEGDHKGGGCVKKVVVVVGYWGGGAGCFLVFVFLAWLLRRAALNRAKVAAFDTCKIGE
ncbi:hypothetical protein ABFS82_12G103300 [Erythranthe guttata]